MTKITKESRNYILSMALGDGYINKAGFLAIRHAQSQLDYLQWKHDVLKRCGIKVSDVYFVDNNGFPAYEFRTMSYDFIKSIRASLYGSGKKIPTKKVLSHLNPIDIAIWYMDDGSLSNEKRNGVPYRTIITLCTCLSKDENQVIIDYFFDKLGIKATQRKMKNSYAIVIGSKQNVIKFIDLVKPYVSQVKCMWYKLNMVYTNIAS